MTYHDTSELIDFLNDTTITTTTRGIAAASARGTRDTPPHAPACMAAPEPASVPLRVPAPMSKDGWDEVMALPTEASRERHARTVFKVPHVGTYTVVDPATGDHRTIKITEQDDQLRPGYKMYKASLMNGPDNERSFTAMAFVKQMDEGQDDRVVVFRAYRDARGDRLIDDLMVLMGDPVAAARRYGLWSGRCGICGRKLTVPASIAEGIGPVCAGKVVRR
jgi:hypothetical protein